MYVTFLSFSFFKILSFLDTSYKYGSNVRTYATLKYTLWMLISKNGAPDILGGNPWKSIIQTYTIRTYGGMFETDTYIREFKMKYQVLKNKDTVYYYAKIDTQKIGVIYKRVGKQK